MRVYLPGTISDLESLEAGQSLKGRTGYALLPEWAATLSDQDPEVLEEELLYLAATQSIKNGQRIVLVAELPVEIVGSDEALVQTPSEISPKQILAMFGDDSANKSAILAGSDPLELDLTWFGPTEILSFKDFLTG